VRRLIWRLEGRNIGTYAAPFITDLARPRVSSLGSTGVPILGLNSRNVGAEAGITKVVVDKLLALAVLVALTPVLAITAAAVKLTSEGPVLFRQVRVGLGGRKFEMLKFRTMTIDAEQRLAELSEQNRHAGGTLFKIPNDPRITPVGRLLRKYSLDELPQLFNVLRGEMSLVGPRPPLPDEVAKYPLDAHRRFCVRPGLTGLWQVSGRSDLDPEQSMQLDTHYVEQWSPALDVRVLARTPGAVISGRGAY
jgi:exopolysaccharide biosynthesis polyprenyl glycosylphosphotransferase